VKALLSWLREFTPLEATPDEIGRAFGMLGTPVESVDVIGEGLDGVVVARILDVSPIKGADYIQLTHVDAGTGDALSVVCGARNIAAGQLVPLATVGASLPNGMEIGRRKMRGQVSEGMLCSPDELGMGARGDGIMILGGDLEPGTAFKDALGISSDVLWDLEINPNRPDAMSVAGLARDLAAWFKVPFALPEPVIVENGDPAGSLVTVEVLDPERCGRFTARVLQDVTVAPSSQLIASRLTLVGMRPINNVVDVSNYVMLELGQPSHPYDLAQVGGGGLRVRRASEGETLVTLDGNERTLTHEELLICDADDVPNGIAGVMGGASSEISETTRDVLVEMAWFLPIGITKSSRRLGLRSEASARFEKGCDPEIIDVAQARFIELLGASVGRVATGTVDVVGIVPDRPPVRVRTSTVNALLGTELDGSDIKGLLDPIGFAATPADADNLVTIPSWRYDSDSEIDVVEEVARHFGYDRIGQEMPTAPRIGRLTDLQTDRRLVRDVMVGLGFAEAVPTPFLAPGDLARTGLPDDGITVTNPLVAEESVLRTSLLPGLLRTVRANQSHRVDDAALFEIGHVFRPPASADATLPDEREFLGVAVAGAEAPIAVQAWTALAEALDVHSPGLLAAEPPGLHPTRAADVVVGGEHLGVVGEVDPGVLEAWGITGRVAWLEVDLGRLLALPHGEHAYLQVSRYPSSDIDLAFATPDAVPAGDVEATLRSAGGDLLVALELFDVYRGAGVPEGSRSLAYRLRFQAVDRTLTDDETAAVRLQCIEAVTAATGASLRT
jgi:phenylalanyl-tRNA synthetase beta chain